MKPSYEEIYKKWVEYKNSNKKNHRDELWLMCADVVRIIIFNEDKNNSYLTQENKNDLVEDATMEVMKKLEKISETSPQKLCGLFWYCQATAYHRMVNHIKRWGRLKNIKQ